MHGLAEVGRHLLMPVNASGDTAVFERKFLKRFDWLDIAALFLLLSGILARLFLDELGPFQAVSAGEASRVAIAFAQGRGIADAYFDGQGPTAHLMPVMPAISGSIYRLLGIGTPEASFALLTLAILQFSCAYAFTYAAFRKSGWPRLALLISSLLLALPLFPKLEMNEFRFWEGSFVTALVAAGLYTMVKWRTVRLSLMKAAALSALGALIFFTNPIAGLAFFGLGGTFYMTRSVADLLRLTTFSAVFVAVLIVPWTLRNMDKLGHPIPLRSNFGLEIALANHPGALTATDVQSEWRRRGAEIHPFKSKQAREQLAARGEVGYFSELRKQTWSWIETHPSDFLWLAQRHFREFYFPPAWTYDRWDKPLVRSVAATIVPPIILLGLCFLVVCAWQKKPLARPLLIYVLLFALPYALVQPLQRYAYPVYVPLVFYAAGLLSELATALARRVAAKSEPPPDPKVA